MQRNSQKTEKGHQNRGSRGAKSLVVATKGVRTSKDFAQFMCLLMADVIEGKVPPIVANAACNAGGKVLKVVEMEHKYGKEIANGGRELVLQK